MAGRLEGKLKSAKYRAGSALVLVVVVTAMLAVVGVMFVMMSRVDSIATSAISENRELSAAVDTVVERINTVLVDDLFGGDDNMLNDDSGSDEYWDYPGPNDAWLANLEPEVYDNGTPLDPNDDIYYWSHVTDLYSNNFGARIFPPYFYDPDDEGSPNQWASGSVFVVSAYDLIAKIISPDDRVSVIEENAPEWNEDYLWYLGARADTDGDGIADSRWVRLPINSSKGRPIFAAVRILDNCGMLNLNTAHSISANSEGQYLSSADYERFLRGNDRSFPDRIRRARDPLLLANTEQTYHGVIMNIENPSPDFFMFDIGDELEIRNRYLLTSLTLARFEREDIGYETFDWGRGFFVGGWNPELRVKRIPFDTTDFEGWKWRMDHRNFDDTSGGIAADAWKYDRRHVCTFYSFDRNVRRRAYPFIRADGTADPNRTDWLLETNLVFSPGVGVPMNINYGISSNTPQSRRNILHLLYAFRAFFLDMDPDAGYQDAARRSAQVVANMIDYMDNYATVGPFYDAQYGGQTNKDLTYDNPTYIDREIIRELILEASNLVIDIGNPAPDPPSPYEFGLGIDDPDEIVYGYERQPFISELYCEYDSDDGGVQAFAIELCNPYLIPNGAISLDGWRIKMGTEEYLVPSGLEVPAASVSPSQELGRLVIKTSGVSVPASGVPEEIAGFGLSLVTGDIVELQRPNPAWESGDPPEDEFITVDATEPAQTDSLTSGDGVHVSKRDDTAWKFADASSYTIPDPCDHTSTLGDKNEALGLSSKGYQMPVPNNNASLATPHDFEMVLFIGNEKSDDPNDSIPYKVGSATSEGGVRFDIESRPELLEYICFMNRPQGNLPGRININTATMEVIRAAIPPNPDWDAGALANNIVEYRDLYGPFERVSDLLSIPEFRQVPDPNTGDAAIGGDFEERDWIVSRVANIFTVRSDVFTAYILVRVGHDGPQKRMIAIFDRSNVYSPTDRPRLVALHPVPDPR
jgi:hypothetical protein